jgi:hypothetical protein
MARNMDLERGERLAVAATRVIKAARDVDGHRMDVDEATYVGLIEHARTLNEALVEFDRQKAL